MARLVSLGLPVPDGFHITTSAYRHFVAANQLQPTITAALEQANLSIPASLERVSQSIRGLFSGSDIPDEITRAIVEAYEKLPGIHPPVAVRSSATAEDLPGASFAGQQETYLNISSPEAVVEAVKQCWASLWTARAIAYRARMGIPAEGIALAVAVQRLVPAEAAGILFTANPVTGDRGEAVISASWGLGEAVVGGLGLFVTGVLTSKKAQQVETESLRQIAKLEEAEAEMEKSLAELQAGLRRVDELIRATIELDAALCRLLDYSDPANLEEAYQVFYTAKGLGELLDVKITDEHGHFTTE